jgi:hypothetical protein
MPTSVERIGQQMTTGRSGREPYVVRLSRRPAEFGRRYGAGSTLSVCGWFQDFHSARESTANEEELGHEIRRLQLGYVARDQVAA